MSDLSASVIPSGLEDRRTIFDRRLGQRRARAIPVPQDRRSGKDRRQLDNRRESPEGHLRNALQVLQALMETASGDIPLHQTLQRLQLALAEIERLERWGQQLGRELRAAQTDIYRQTRSP
jgi:hypothetical protein